MKAPTITPSWVAAFFSLASTLLRLPVREWWRRSREPLLPSLPARPSRLHNSGLMLAGCRLLLRSLEPARQSCSKYVRQ